MSPSDLSSKSLGLCAHHPFLEQAIDFDAIDCPRGRRRRRGATCCP
nr:hypothetical protein [Herbaspirillum lusitanum]